MTAGAGELWLRLYLELSFTYGWRKTELLGLRVRQGNLALGTIRLEPGTTKNKTGCEVAMTAKVRELWTEAIRGKGAKDFVLTGEGNKPIKDYRDAWQNLCVRAGLGHWVCLPCLQKNVETPSPED